MGKLSDLFKSLSDRWRGYKKGTKVAFGVSFAGLVIIIIYLSVYLGAAKYSVLFSDLEATQAKLIMDKLKEKKVTDYKVSGNSILVPTDQVNELRLELAPEIDSADSGWTLFDGGNTLGTTDAELKIKYQRAIQTELEKTIKGFPQIERARVALVLPEDSVFVKDTTPASASITLMMKSGQSLSHDQVRAIVALVTGSVKNLPKENVQVVDDKMTLLSKGIFEEDKMTINTATEKQQQYKKDLEEQLEKKAMEHLSKPYKNKVTIKVNADLDFDATESIINKVEPNGTVISEKYVRDVNGNVTTRPSQSPLDNNMTNNTPEENDNINSDATHQEETKNYEVSKSETKTIKAPGTVKRVTASVIIDGKLDDASKEQVRGIVANVIGFNETRGDSITVEGIQFDDSEIENAKKGLEELKLAEEQEKKMSLYKQLIGVGVGVFAFIVAVIVFFSIKRKRSNEREQLEDMIEPKSIDVLVGNDVPKTSYKPIDFDVESSSEKAHIEKEIKKYAAEKPEQVVDIIKSWLAEDER